MKNVPKTEITWDGIIQNIEQSMNNGSNIQRFALNDDNEILCKSEEDAECIADLLELVYGDVIHTSCDETQDSMFKYQVYPD